MSYRSLITALSTAFHDDPRVVGTYLGGSRGRGTDDAHSDVDVILSVAAADHESLCADMTDLVAGVGTIVHSQRVGRLPVFTFIAEPWLRFDVALSTPSEVADRPADELIDLASPDALALTRAPAAVGGPTPDPALVEGLTREFLRVMGLLPVILGRNEPALGVAGFGLLHGLTIRAIRLSAVDAPATGMMTLRALADPEVHRRLEDLPPVEATPASVIAAHRACAELFLPLARELHRRSEAPWPAAMADALFAHLAAEVDASFAALAD